MVMTIRTSSFVAAVFVFGFLADLSCAKRTWAQEKDMEIEAEESSVNVGVSGDLHEVPSANKTLAQDDDDDLYGNQDDTPQESYLEEDQVGTKLDAKDADQDDALEESYLEDDQVGTKLDAEDASSDEDEDEDEEDEKVHDDPPSRASKLRELDEQLEALQVSLLEAADDDEEELEGHVSLLEAAPVKIPDDFQFCRSFCILEVFPSGKATGDDGTIHYLTRRAEFSELAANIRKKNKATNRPLCHHAWTKIHGASVRPVVKVAPKQGEQETIPETGTTTYLKFEGNPPVAKEAKDQVALPLDCQVAISKYETTWKLPTAKQCLDLKGNNRKGDIFTVMTLSNHYGKDGDNVIQCKAEWQKLFEESNLIEASKKNPKDKDAKKRLSDIKTAKAAAKKEEDKHLKEEKAIHNEKHKQLVAEDKAKKKADNYDKMTTIQKAAFDAEADAKLKKLAVAEEKKQIAAQKKAEKAAAKELEQAKKYAAAAAKAKAAADAGKKKSA